MAYSADSFVADEQPTTAKWNKLWSNDASFNDGTGIANNAIAAPSLATNAILLGVGTATANQGSIITEVNLTNLSAAITVPAGGRSLFIVAKVNMETSVANDQLILYMKRDPSTYIQSCIQTLAVANRGRTFVTFGYVSAPSAGSYTYRLSAERSTGSGTVTMTASSTAPAIIAVFLV